MMAVMLLHKGISLCKVNGNYAKARHYLDTPNRIRRLSSSLQLFSWFIMAVLM